MAGRCAGKPVLVLLNPLWMTSPEQDLQGKSDGEARFNHPKLVAQVWHRPRVYRPAAGGRGRARCWSVTCPS